MLDHISIGVTNLGLSVAFYDAVLAPLGYHRLWRDKVAAGYGLPGSDEPFAIKQEDNSKVAISKRFHIAFQASTHRKVIEFYEAALAVGAPIDGMPELHPMYGEAYFAAFVYDPDGYRIEAVCHQ